MVEEKMMRLSQAARKLNVGLTTIVEHLESKGHSVDSKPNAKITMEQFAILAKEFEESILDREEASNIFIGAKKNENKPAGPDDSPAEQQQENNDHEEEEELLIKGLNRQTSDSKTSASSEKPAEKKQEEQAPEEDNKEDKYESPRLQGPKVVGKIDLDSVNSKKKSKKDKPGESKEAKPKATQSAKSQGEARETKELKSEASTKPSEEPKAEKTKPSEQPEQEVKAEEQGEKPVESKTEEPVADKKPGQPDKEDKASTEEQQQEVEKEEIKKVEEPTAEHSETKPEATSDSEEVLTDSVQDKEEPTSVEPEKEAKAPESDEIAEEEGNKQQGQKSVVSAKAQQLKGLTVLGKIDLPAEKKPGGSKSAASSTDPKKKKRKRKRIRVENNRKPGGGDTRGGANAPTRSKDDRRGKKPVGKKGPQKTKEEPSEKEIQEQIKETLARLSGNKNSKVARGSKNRAEKRKARAEQQQIIEEQEQEQQVLKVTEFISANDLAALMDVSVNDVISKCMGLGLVVSINQRLDAETITIIADEFDYEVDFTDTKEEAETEFGEEEGENEDSRAPIVTIMGHVDHGKTSLLDYVRKAKVTAGEAGGITQHIGAYDVLTESDKRITFLDTPGHEAFTAMRARGAKVTDVVVIVVAADDNVMPQTKEAINHAQVADVPIIIAINKVDKPNANPDKIREELANINILVEDWGGKYQCQEISAKTGMGVDDLLEKILLESELLELKASDGKRATGTVVEATLDRGRGYVTTLLVQNGTLRVGDVVLAGAHFGKVKAMFDHRGKKLDEATPATPVQMLGLDGAPQAGDNFRVMESDRDAREIATKREQILREQNLRTKKHITLDEIGRRLAIGTFKELNIIVKGDVDGSIEALSDSMLKLSTNEIQVNIIHKAVGQISESDVLLASASDAIIVGFQVRPSPSARAIAEKEEIEIRLYSIIYDAIEEIKDAMEGMLAPSVEETITGNAEVRRVFKISKVGTVAGCYMTDGSIKRNNRVRLIRDGIVVYTGEINQLKREKDDVNEVKTGFECGISIKNFNDVKEGDVIEAFEEKEIKRKLN